MTHLRFSVPLYETKGDSLAGIVSGVASTFGPPADLAGDVIVKGAFQESLKQHAAQGSSVAMLYCHSQDMVVGKWQDIYEDDDGLNVKGILAKGVRVADECLKLAGLGALALSIGFRPVRQKAMKDANYIEQVDLAEISLVGVPANRRTNLSVKSLDSISEYQQFLRDCGLSVRESKALARGGWSAFRGSDTDFGEIADLIRASSTKFRGIKI